MGKVIDFEEGKRRIILKHNKNKIYRKKEKYKYNLLILTIIVIFCFTTIIATVNYQNYFQSTNILEKKVGMSLF
ncbi:hypothetical protein [Caloranaerobacter ferrireducens]|uniref:hypothetical protein n=1 Tax=Caloranaerobacter ferrireducens TaxID=1323370 RepID=UPI00084E0021|nr:hypothetical protein [Caloranaerobacter ferrireducens]